MPPVLQIQWNIEYCLICCAALLTSWPPSLMSFPYIAHFLLAMLRVPIVLIFLMACQRCTPPITYYVYNVYLTLIAY